MLYQVPFPTEMMEMMDMPSTAPLVMGRRLAPMLMTHDTESNRKVLKVERGLNRIGPLCLILLIPQIIAAIQAALAGKENISVIASSIQDIELTVSVLFTNISKQIVFQNINSRGRRSWRAQWC